MLKPSECSAIVRIFSLSGVKKLYVVLSIISIFVIGLNISQDYILKLLLQNLKNKDYKAVTSILIGFVCIFISLTIFGYFKQILTVYLVQKNTGNLKLKLFNKVLSLPSSEEKRKNDALSVIAFDAEELAQFLPISLLGFIFSFLTFTAYAFFCFYLSPIMTIAAIILIIPSVLIEKIYIPRIEVKSKKFSQSESSIRTFLQEAVQSFDIIKIFQISGAMQKKLSTLDLERSKNKTEYTHLSSILFACGNMLSYMAILGMFAVGAFLYVKKCANLADLIVCLGAIEKGLVWPASNFLQNITDLSNKKVDYERVNGFLDIKEHNRNDYRIERCGTLEIFLTGVCFSYLTENEKSLLNNINLEIKNNSKICITGESGTGKTTLLNLILNFIQPQKGSITFNYNSKIYEGAPQNLIAFVPQTDTLFMDTVYENIRFGNSEASEQEIIAAAKKAGAHNFIMQTEAGYNTIVGGKETKLSGGQAQRIAIARAVLKKSPLLIMDEPSSALDGETEKKIIDLIKEYAGTVIYISHRNELIQAADKILRFDNGSLIEETIR